MARWTSSIRLDAAAASCRVPNTTVKVWRRVRSSRRHGSRSYMPVWRAPATTRGWAACMSRARTPPILTDASRSTCQETLPGPNSPASGSPSRMAPTVRPRGPTGTGSFGPRPEAGRPRSGRTGSSHPGPGSDACGGPRVGGLGVGDDVDEVGHARVERPAQRRPDAVRGRDQLPGAAQGGNDLVVPAARLQVGGHVVAEEELHGVLLEPPGAVVAADHD